MCTEFDPLAPFPPPLQRDEGDFIAFCHWIEDLHQEGEQPYLQEVIRLDVRPCLAFENVEVRVQTNCLP